MARPTPVRGVVAALLLAAGLETPMSAAPQRPGEVLAERLLERLGSWSAPFATDAGRTPAVPVTRWRELARPGEWTERWPGPDGQVVERPVQGIVWSDAIEAALAAADCLLLPALDQPYYLDRPIVLGSGQSLVAEPAAEIRLKPGVNTCLVRNRRLVGAKDGPVPADLVPDTDILIEGGIWTTLATAPRESNGNHRGRADDRDSVPGAHGVILLANVRRAVVRNLCVRQSRPFGVQVGVGAEILVEGLRFDAHRRDGVHVEGPCEDLVIRDITGVTGDDLVALNAWDWHQYSLAFGPIRRVLVDHIRGHQPVAGGGVLPDGSAEIRLLPGTKVYPDGTRLACDLEQVVVRRTRAIRTFKLYDQPNLEKSSPRDAADPIGRLRDVHLFDVVTRPTAQPLVQIAVDADGLWLDDLELQAERLPDGYALVGIGPQSATWRPNPGDPSTWVEIFSPDRDNTVRRLHLGPVRLVRPDGTASELAPWSLVKVIEQTVNPDYPRTWPRGGTGRGHLVR